MGYPPNRTEIILLGEMLAHLEAFLHGCYPPPKKKRLNDIKKMLFPILSLYWYKLSIVDIESQIKQSWFHVSLRITGKTMAVMEKAPIQNRSREILFKLCLTPCLSRFFLKIQISKDPPNNLPLSNKAEKARILSRRNLCRNFMEMIAEHFRKKATMSNRNTAAYPFRCWGCSAIFPWKEGE